MVKVQRRESNYDDHKQAEIELLCLALELNRLLQLLLGGDGGPPRILEALLLGLNGLIQLLSLTIDSLLPFCNLVSEKAKSQPLVLRLGLSDLRFKLVAAIAQLLNKLCYLSSEPIL